MLDIVTEYINLVVHTEAVMDNIDFEIKNGNVEKAMHMNEDNYSNIELELAFENVMDYLNIPVPSIEECLNQYK